MKNFKALFLVLFGICAHYSCSNNSTNESGLHIVNIEEALANVKDVKLSDYATAINYYTLETADSALLGTPSKIAFDKEYIYIGSTDKMKTVHIFSKDGKFIKNVGTRGRAKGEYLAIRTIVPLPDMNAVMVEGGNKAVIYSLEDGKAIMDIPFDELLTEQETTSRQINGRNVTSNSQNVTRIFNNGRNSFIVLTFNQKTGKQELIFTDTSLAIKNRIALRPSELSSTASYTQRGGVIKMSPMHISGSCHIINGEINFFHGMKDTLYTVNENGITPKMAINYGYYCNNPYQRSEEDIWASIHHESGNLIFLDARMPLSNQQEANSVGTAHMIYDKIKKETRLLKFSEDFIGDPYFQGGGAFLNDLDNGLPFWPVDIIGNKMYMSCDAGKFIEFSKKYNSPQMKIVAAKLTEDSNPVLVEVILK